MKITKEQHATNVKNFMLNMTDATEKAIIRGDDPRECKKFRLYLKQTNDYCNKYNIYKEKKINHTN